MGRWLALASALWLAALGGAVVARHRGAHTAWTHAVYLAASTVCHQQPERSFFTHGVQWPVCGRCSGLYLAAPLGALAALGRRRSAAKRLRAVLAIAAVPTAVTLAIEWPGVLPVSSLVRFLAAIPLGAALAYALVKVTEGEIH